MAKTDLPETDSNMLDPSLIKMLQEISASYPDAPTIVGYTAESTDPAWVRLCVETDLQDYVEVHHEGIKERLDYGTGRKKTVLWLNPHARLREVHVPTAEIQARFASGSITDKYLRDYAFYPVWSVAIKTTIDPSVTCKSVCLLCTESPKRPIQP